MKIFTRPDDVAPARMFLWGWNATLGGIAVMYSELTLRSRSPVLLSSRSMPRRMDPTAIASPAGDHRGFSGNTHRPVWLLCRALQAFTKPLPVRDGSYTRTVSSNDMVARRHGESPSAGLQKAPWEDLPCSSCASGWLFDPIFLRSQTQTEESVEDVARSGRPEGSTWTLLILLLCSFSPGSTLPLFRSILFKKPPLSARNTRPSACATSMAEYSSSMLWWDSPKTPFSTSRNRRDPS
mmetsp:Transcript_6697/g.18759  ORF Transcript_6697/g.18759 Transcript_6697/m.18759 type:complete len:238 (+) Transcript_6697:576-1289(+)